MKRTGTSIGPVLVAAAVGGLYLPTMTSMAWIWWTDTYSSHGIFVPLFTAYLLWIDRRSIAMSAAPDRRTGPVVLLSAIALLGVGHALQDLVIQGLSMVVASAGFVLWCFGRRALRRAAFPLAFLMLMVPVPRAAVEAVTLNLQLFAASFAAGTLRLLDIPVYRAGVALELPTMSLQVAEVCNGLRFLLALLVLTTAFAHLTQNGLTRKVALIVSAIPVAILANAVRVAVIAVGVHYVGPQVASGFIHHSIGKAVWILTLVPLIVLGVALARTGPREALPTGLSHTPESAA